MNSRNPVFLLSLFFLYVGAFAQEASVRFAFLADLHYSEGGASVSDLRRCIEDINGTEGLDFVIVGGDLTDFGSDEELVAVKEMLDSLKYDFYVVAGNHDAKWSESGCNTFLKVFGYESFAFECGGWRFIGCNSGPDMRMAPALIPRESMDWLREVPSGERTVFINHYPQDSSVLNYFDVTRELKRIGTRIAIGGHLHRNVSIDCDGLPGVLCRSTLSSGTNPGYSIVEITGDRITVSEKRLLGSTSVRLEPWYRRNLEPVTDTVNYDPDGLPSGYPWMKYDVNGSNSLTTKWAFEETSNVAAGFASDGRRAWYTTVSGCVRCISIKDGTRIWSRQFEGKIFSTPAVSGKLLVFGCTDGFVYALDKKTGDLKWKRAAGKSILASPVVYGGKVFIGASDGCFRALDLKDGATVWEYPEVKGFVECRPFVDASQVVFGSWDGRLYSLSTLDGSLQWIWECGKHSRMYSPAAVWPVKADGKIFIAVPDRRLYVLDAATGRELKYFDGIARESAGLSEDGSTVYCKSMWHKLTAIDTHTLDVRWQSETEAGYDIAPTHIAQTGNTVLMPTDKGNIIGFSTGGDLIWKHKISIALVNPMTVWNKKGKTFLLASTMDGTITLIEYENQSL